MRVTYSLCLTLITLTSLVHGQEQEQEVRVGSLSQSLLSSTDSQGDAIAAGMIRERYPDGRVRLERGVKQDADGNFINHGEWRSFDNNGQMLISGTYVDGKMDGDWTRWYRDRRPAFLNGKEYEGFQLPLVSLASFTNGQIDGVWVITDAKDHQLLQIELKQGRRDGLATFYHATGKKAREVTYMNGDLHGADTTWNAKGEKTAEAHYLNGRQQIHRVIRDKAKANVILEELNLLGPHVTSTTRDDWTNGELAAHRASGEPLRHGVCRIFHPNGQIRHEGEFQEGIEIGKHSWWFATGQLAIQGEFVDGKRSGAWIWHHENGLPKVLGRYENGERVGKWTAWTESGQVDSSTNGSNPTLATRADNRK